MKSEKVYQPWGGFLSFGRWVCLFCAPAIRVGALGLGLGREPHADWKRLLLQWPVWWHRGQALVFGVNSSSGVIVGMPAPDTAVAVWRCRLADSGFPPTAMPIPQAVAAVVIRRQTHDWRISNEWASVIHSRDGHKTGCNGGLAPLL